ncbi:MAG: chemotaxis response regulator protein-glutamate methylesterase, partial [Candidatus Heimdallarchaeota archaeon]|nr:chemotaxis response regulator protein-glutamate methylesterase [Candidatus Heimdallarchaeota archaeon]
MIRVLVVDDSALMRKRISDIINSQNDMEVVAIAKTGAIAMEKVLELKPDVVTMDLIMPDVDGFTALNYIMHELPTPVVVISANATPESSNVAKALKLGAVSVLEKPSGEISLDIEKIDQAIIDKIRRASTVNVKQIHNLMKHMQRKPPKPHASPSVNSTGIEKAVVIGASTGGPKAIKEIMLYFSADLPAAFLIIQHMPAVFTKAMADRINAETKIEIKEAEDGDIIQAGYGYVAPGGYHMVLTKIGNDTVIRLTEDPPVSNVRPSITITMNSAAKIFRDKTIGVLLTGMGQDGVEGLRSIQQFGGKTLAEHESTCVVYGMPKVAIKEGVVDTVVSLHHMGIEIIKQIK